MKNLSLHHDKNKIAHIVFLNNRKNSFSPEASDELVKILNQLEKIDCRGLIFKSETPRFFCSGGDLKYYSELESKEPGVLANKKITKNLEKLFLFQVPTLAIVDGLCVGGGLELLSCFDYVFSSTSSLFSMWQRKVGLSFGWGGQARLIDRVGKANIKKYFLNCQNLTAYQALDINLVDKVLPKHLLENSATNFIESMIHLPLSPLELYKKNSANPQAIFENLWLSAGHKSALSAFAKKK